MSGPTTSEPVASGQQPDTQMPGLVKFAGIMLIVSGLWGVLAGISEILNDKIFVATPQYVYSFDLTAWGWVHVIFGLLAAAAGFGVLKGTAWGRMLGVVLASANLLINFAFIPYYPIWSILIIALDVLIIWQLASQPWGDD
jgi:hypothetical protein